MINDYASIVIHVYVHTYTDVNALARGCNIKEFLLMLLKCIDRINKNKFKSRVSIFPEYRHDAL